MVDPRGRREVRRAFARVDDSVGAARRFVSLHVADDEVRARAVLLTSELASNAVKHGSGETFEVRLLLGERVRVEVSDASFVAPHADRPGPEAPSGRGLVVVGAFAASWGSEATAGGKVVWAELESDRAS